MAGKAAGLKNNWYPSLSLELWLLEGKRFKLGEITRQKHLTIFLWFILEQNGVAQNITFLRSSTFGALRNRLYLFPNKANPSFAKGTS
ncbi:MAG: hypothetical protein NC911_01085 [Candidatus Omnitrophica bacterium]|nr:hypothetical protein [Candidatus Omnitrophota bacterium]